jgi:hypothetical protein
VEQVVIVLEAGTMMEDHHVTKECLLELYIVGIEEDVIVLALIEFIVIVQIHILAWELVAIQ